MQTNPPANNLKTIINDGYETIVTCATGASVANALLTHLHPAETMATSILNHATLESLSKYDVKKEQANVKPEDGSDNGPNRIFTTAKKMDDLKKHCKDFFGENFIQEPVNKNDLSQLQELQLHFASSVALDAISVLGEPKKNDDLHNALYGGYINLRNSVSAMGKVCQAVMKEKSNLFAPINDDSQTDQEKNTRYVYTTHTTYDAEGQKHDFLAITRLWEQTIGLDPGDSTPPPENYSDYLASPGIDYIDTFTVLFDKDGNAVAKSHAINGIRAHTNTNTEHQLIAIFDQFNEQRIHKEATTFFNIEKNNETYQEVVQEVQAACIAVTNPNSMASHTGIDNPTPFREENLKARIRILCLRLEQAWKSLKNVFPVGSNYTPRR